MTRATGIPLLVDDAGSQLLARRSLAAHGGYDEAWLQQLLIDHPALLPISQIEPGFGPLIPIATEVPCGHGYIDNLYLTPTGDIVLVEAKLWRNPEARRLAIAQALDYTAALTGISYPVFEAMILKGKLCRPGSASLYACVADDPDRLDEAPFIDAVAANLVRGRMLVLIAGDGIRRELELLTGLLQNSMASAFTLALVELAIFDTSAGLVVVPQVLLQTVLIERGVITLANDRIALAAPPPAATPAKAQSLSEAAFYAALDGRRPGLATALKAFLADLEPYGVRTELRAALSLRLDLPELPRPVSLGYIEKNGALWTDALARTVPLTLARRYTEEVAVLFGGQLGYTDPARTQPRLTSDGRAAPRLEQLLPAHAERWAAAITWLAEQLRQQAEPM